MDKPLELNPNYYKNAEGYNLISNEPVEWCCDCYRGFWGYQLHNNYMLYGSGLPVFTHDQMLNAQRIERAFSSKYDGFATLIYNAVSDSWLEAYPDGDDLEIIDELEPIYVDGVKLYQLGTWTGWAWGLYDESCDWVEWSDSEKCGYKPIKTY